jgi:hypothetical protein
MTTAELANRLADRFEALAADLRADALAASTPASATPTATTPPTPSASAPSAGRTKPWTHVEDLAGKSYKWPDEPVEDYAPFSVSETADPRGSVRIGIGYPDQAAIDRSSRKRPYLVTFEVVGQKAVRPLVVFTATDDHASTGDFVGVIKGKGPRKTEMFGPGDVLPPEYAGLEIVVFRDHVSGAYSYNKLAVIARGGNVDAILDHALLQLRLRFS